MVMLATAPGRLEPHELLRIERRRVTSVDRMGRKVHSWVLVGVYVDDWGNERVHGCYPANTRKEDLERILGLIERGERLVSDRRGDTVWTTST